MRNNVGAGTPLADKAAQNNAHQVVIGFPFCDGFFLPPAWRQDSPVAVCFMRMGGNNLLTSARCPTGHQRGIWKKLVK